MVIGLNIFSEFFKDFPDSYLIIGGTACDIIIEDAGFIPRATDDIDIILLIEAFAYLNNKERKERGQNVKKWDIVKHKYDVFRMVFMLNQADVFETPDIIKTDLQKFADTVKTDLPDTSIFKENGFGKQDMRAIYEQLLQSFNLNA